MLSEVKTDVYPVRDWIYLGDTGLISWAFWGTACFLRNYPSRTVKDIIEENGSNGTGTVKGVDG